MSSHLTRGAIIHEFNTNAQILTPFAPSLDPNGFDTGSLRVDFRGSEDSLINTYKKGTRLGSMQMYCTGVQSIEDARFGWITASIGYKGFYSASESPGTVDSFSAESYERIWPFKNGDTTYYMDGRKAGQSTALNPLHLINGSAQPFRVRQMLQKAFINREGVDIGTAGTPHIPPSKPQDPRPPFLGTAISNLADPLCSTEPSGWIRRSYKVTNAERYGTVIFRSWSDAWEYVDRESE